MASIIPGLFGLDSASAWRALSKDPNKYITKFSKDKAVQAEIAYFEKKAPAFKDVDALMKDRRALQYLLDSYGLGSEINNAGRIKKILTEDPTKADALVNRLADTRFKAMASSLRLDQGMDKLQRLSFRDTMEDKYIQNEFEEALGQQDASLRQAAYFARNSSTIGNVYAVMGDKILRDVVTSTFNLPAAMAIQPVETQAKVIAARIDVTKFSGGINTTVSATQLSRAKTDHDLIGKNLAVSDAALKQIKTLQQQISQLGTDYANLDTITNPSGGNASLITLQKNAVPELVRFEELLRKGDSALDSVDKNLGLMQGLIAEAKKSGSNMNDLKTQFDSLVNAINSQIDNATVNTHLGSENILLNGSADTQNVVYNESGANVNMNRYDATALKTMIADAQSAFGAITDETDMTNILAAEGRLLRSQDNANAMHNQINTDLTALGTSVTGNGFFAASLNTTDLMRGKQSVDDALSRNTQIAGLLDKISTLAATSKNMDPAADRSALQTQFNDYRTQIRNLVENTGTAGLDNFLNNIPDQNYEIVNGKMIEVKGNLDLNTNLADVLDTLNLDDPTNAAALETQSIMLTNQTDAAKRALEPNKPILDRVVSTYDPRARLDSQVIDLKAKLDSFIAGAAKEKINLLSPEQADIKLSMVSTGSTVTFRSQTTLKNDLLTGLNTALSQLGGTATDMMNAVDDINDVLNRAQRNLQSDNRLATMEHGRLGATIDTLDPQNITETSNMYKTNAFTQKFLLRYLGLAGSNGGNGATSYLSNLFGGTDMNSATANLMSLALSIKA